MARMGRFTLLSFVRWLVLALSLALAAGAAHAQKRVALVIGNSAYQAGSLPPLKNAVRDAELMAKTLEEMNFKVIKLTNGSEDDMGKAIREFGRQLAAAGPESVGFYYFAGHGVQSGGINYMVPVDAEVQTIEDVEAEAPRMGLVLRQMELAKNKINFVVLDACRNNNLPAQNRDASRGFAAVSTEGTQGLLIAYSTRPGAVADDGEGQNSPYTATLARLMKTEQAPALNVFSRVSEAVRKDTNNRQQPWMENGLQGDGFCFVACSTNGVRLNHHALEGFDLWNLVLASQPKSGAADADQAITITPSTDFPVEGGRHIVKSGDNYAYQLQVRKPGVVAVFDLMEEAPMQGGGYARNVTILYPGDPRSVLATRGFSPTPESSAQRRFQPGDSFILPEGGRRFRALITDPAAQSERGDLAVLLLPADANIDFSLPLYELIAAIRKIDKPIYSTIYSYEIRR